VLLRASVVRAFVLIEELGAFEEHKGSITQRNVGIAILNIKIGYFPAHTPLFCNIRLWHLLQLTRNVIENRKQQRVNC
jgi:hypothetical protein